jgi:hypothetical protein
VTAARPDPGPDAPGEELLGAPRFPRIAPDRGHYESWFVKARHPGEPKAFWLRHTVHQRPGEAPTASLWLTLFDGDTVAAGKQTFPAPAVPPGGYIRIGPSELGPGTGRGAVRSPTLDADWAFTFSGGGPGQRHLPATWMYRAPLPRTKSGTPHPGVTFAGRVGPFAVDGWRGLVSHNWGAEHAERWIWLHAALEDDGWIELVLGRVRVGGLVTPWIANGALELAGERRRLGGLGRVRSTRVDERPTGARFVVGGEAGLRVEGAVTAPPARFVCWRYADPGGGERHSAHSSLADLRLRVWRHDGREPVTLMAPMAASYELGMRETDHGLPVQPYDDGRL